MAHGPRLRSCACPRHLLVPRRDTTRIAWEERPIRHGTPGRPPSERGAASEPPLARCRTSLMQRLVVGCAACHAVSACEACTPPGRHADGATTGRCSVADTAGITGVAHQGCRPEWE